MGLLAREKHHWQLLVLVPLVLAFSLSMGLRLLVNTMENPSKDYEKFLILPNKLLLLWLAMFSVGRVPSPEQRLDILCTLLNEIVHSLSIKEIQSLALGTHGFVGADLSALCNEAAMTALRRYISVESKENHSNEVYSGIDDYIGHTYDPGLHKDEDVQTADPVDSLSSSLLALNMSSEQVTSVSATKHWESSSASQCGSHEPQTVEAKMSLKVTVEDFEKAKMKVRPSAMREVLL
ncbi:hypothetical protein GW17_00020247 [Ensete ventricosum]|nr:hypothetical protein GW17_00020247 [Ensete ventricosum]